MFVCETDFFQHTSRFVPTVERDDDHLVALGEHLQIVLEPEVVVEFDSLHHRNEVVAVDDGRKDW